MRSTFSNLKNMFKVPDLRNKILFTVVIIAIYRFGQLGSAARASTSRRCTVLESASAHTAGVLGFLNLFSGGALTHFAVFGLGIMPYITASIIIQLLIVVIPKFEQWRDEGAVGQKKLTQTTRYLTIALAVHAVDRPGLRLPQRRGRLPRRRHGPQHRPDPEVHRAAGCC